MQKRNDSYCQDSGLREWLVSRKWEDGNGSGVAEGSAPGYGCLLQYIGPPLGASRPFPGFFHHRPNRFLLLRYAERRYHELILLANEYNAAAHEKHDRMAEKFSPGQAAVVAEVEDHVKPAIIGRLESNVAAIRVHLERDEKDYLAATAALSSVTAAAFPRKRKPRTRGPRQPRYR